MNIKTSLWAGALALAIGPAAMAQQAEDDPFTINIDKMSDQVGEMSMEVDVAADPRFEAVSEVLADHSLIFEPYQMRNDLGNGDLVYLMRHGPTDWTYRDENDVAPGDCEHQRGMSPEGREDMRAMGLLMAGTGIRPGKIVVSEWCRNQQTLDSLKAGMEIIAPEYAETIEVETDPAANLLLSLQGAPNVTALRERISAWEGSDNGPLLIISHYTNIAELTEFRVYEGEALILDPARDNRVLGYLRLRSAEPDVGHFDEEVVDDG